MKIEELRALLVKCWKNGSSKGQCYVTALIVQDFFGGDMLRYKDDLLERSHYWNLLPDGREIDLTSDQHGGDGFSPIFHITDYYPHIFTREQKLYPYYSTVLRYAELMLKLSKLLDPTLQGIHVHLAYFGSELACPECNPNCYKNHGMGKSNWCGDKNCPMNPKNFKKSDKK